MVKILTAVMLLAVACGGTEAEAASVAALQTAPVVGLWNGRSTINGTAWPLATLTHISAGADGILTIEDVCGPPGPEFGPKADMTSATTFDVRSFECPAPPWRQTSCSSAAPDWLGLYIAATTTVTGGHGSISPTGEITLTLTGTRSGCGPSDPQFSGPYTVTFVGTRG